MRLKKIGAHIIFFSLFFVLLYNEQSVIAGIKFSYLWKIPLIGLISFYSIKNFKKPPLFARISFVYVLKNIITVGFFIYLGSTFFYTLKVLIFPLFFLFFFCVFNYTQTDKLKQILITFSAYIIISCIPVLLGIVEPVSEGIDLNNYGEEGSFGFVGIFENPHTLSIYLSFSIITLLYFIEHKKGISRLFLLALILLGVYLSYKTLVRTGWLMLFFGFFLISLYKRSIKRVMAFIPIAIILSLIVINVYKNDEVLQDRVTDNKHLRRDKKSKYEMVGSGRLVIYERHLKVFINSDPVNILFGNGATLTLVNLVKNGYKALFPHNGFIYVLVINGLIGITIFLFFLIHLYRFIKRYRFARFQRLAITMYIMYISFLVTQGGNRFLFDIGLALVFAILWHDNQKNLIQNQKQLLSET